ncbi:MAG: ATPase [Flavobacteriales bacterium]|nr:ATPase [Flavobacteriales bacterium]
MVLIADSGSTKCDWKLMDGDREVGAVSTMGFNPFFHSESIISATIKAQGMLYKYADQITDVYIYSAGCSSPELNKVVENALRTLFRKANIRVDHDVLGAALAACQGQEGIACILGTGSNSCYYDGNGGIYEEIPSLAYILGDEGSGSWYGKQVLRDYLYKEPIPEELREELVNQGHTKTSILENIYMQPHANVYLASFMKTISKFRETEYVKNMIHDGMRAFLLRHVCCFKNHKEVQVNFVGSIAYYFQDILKEEAEKLGITVGNVVKKPIDGLVEYHLKHAIQG